MGRERERGSKKKVTREGRRDTGGREGKEGKDH